MPLCVTSVSSKAVFDRDPQRLNQTAMSSPAAAIAAAATNAANAGPVGYETFVEFMQNNPVYATLPLRKQKFRYLMSLREVLDVETFACGVSTTPETPEKTRRDLRTAIENRRALPHVVALFDAWLALYNDVDLYRRAVPAPVPVVEKVVVVKTAAELEVEAKAAAVAEKAEKLREKIRVITTFLSSCSSKLTRIDAVLSDSEVETLTLTFGHDELPADLLKRVHEVVETHFYKLERLQGLGRP